MKIRDISIKQIKKIKFYSPKHRESNKHFNGIMKISIRKVLFTVYSEIIDSNLKKIEKNEF